MLPDHRVVDSGPYRLTRVVLFVTALVLIVFQVGFVLKAPWAIMLWPWLDTPLTYLFVGSILAAVALPIAWVALSGEFAALRAGALDFAVSYAGIGCFFYFNLPSGGSDVPLGYLLFALGGVLLNLWIYWTTRKIPFRDALPMPRLVRWSFLLFALLLTVVGMALILKLPHVFPWPLIPATSVVVGWIFLGAAVYFLHGVARPLWSNACGQLIGFMAYDMVLLWPFIRHIENVKDEHRLSLLVYIGVLMYSLLLAVYFLFLHRSTRLGQRFASNSVTAGSSTKRFRSSGALDAARESARTVNTAAARA